MIAEKLTLLFQDKTCLRTERPTNNKNSSRDQRKDCHHNGGRKETRLSSRNSLACLVPFLRAHSPTYVILTECLKSQFIVSVFMCSGINCAICETFFYTGCGYLNNNNYHPDFPGIPRSRFYAMTTLFSTLLFHCRIQHRKHCLYWAVTTRIGPTSYPMGTYLEIY